ncbi:uncharacterized protein KQ657_004369 [Scheffersomyces spartinae]|uniref:Uncharacterized protein n=1 Tax=Scheffersomyces spartinae TaxID=45513 RepID=A0A9P7VB89_9ASCO|nr:uncharacterized protein KQ657_004369 [Scheffersomyces spartinae]KAG7194692.1 hypothetical protein KQ657_004369 [Scheffersomyces spartinae]
MTVERHNGIIESPRDSKETLIVISGSQSLLVKYETRHNHDVYYVNNVLILGSLVKGFIQKQIQPIMIVIYDDLRSFLGALKVLYNLNQTNSVQFEHTFSECDSPIQFKTYFMIPSKLITADILSSQSISAQLFARALSLKHGATVVSHTNDLDWVFELIINNDNNTFDLLRPKPVAEEKNNLILYIPKGWDSWSKISLLAKVSLGHGSSIPQLANDKEYTDFIHAYEQYLRNDDMWMLLQENSKSTASASNMKSPHKPSITLTEYLNNYKVVHST